MHVSEFNFIKYFTPHEIEETGATLESVDYETIRMLDQAREILGWPFHLMKNGLTSGNHKSEEHPKGRAVDFAAPASDPVRVALVLTLVGFHGVGVYRNHRGAYCFHADRRKNLGVWYGTKSGPRAAWDYSQPLQFKE